VPDAGASAANPAEEKRREINNPAASPILALSVFFPIFIPFRFSFPLYLFATNKKFSGIV
jgi:hypothetical protein